MDKKIKEWERRMFSAASVATILSEICRELQFSYTRLMRSEEEPDAEEIESAVRDNAEWLKAVLPGYIDIETERLLSLQRDIVSK